MKNNHELKQLAKNSMNGYTSTLVLSMIIYIVVSKILGYIQIGETAILQTVLLPILTIGLYSQALNLTLGNGITIKDLFINFNLMLKSLLVNIIINVPIILITIPIIFVSRLTLEIAENNIDYFMESASIRLLIILAILVLTIIGAWYILIITSQINFVILDNTDLNVIDIIKHSIALTKNNKLRIFLLDLSFIPLQIVSIIFLGIPDLWVKPYYITAKAHLYNDLKESYCANIF